MNTPCNCCEPSAPLTPADVTNRPGLSAVAYRVGTYASFRESMLEQIARTPELAALTTRRDDDYAITLMDLWAAVADVLTFYQERYANEAFLRTATLRESIGRLARLIDYSLRPGVAATTSLAFTLDTGKALAIPAGLRVQSVPAQGQQPQTFETLEAVAADARLNRLRVYPAPVPANPFAPGKLEAVLDRTLGPKAAAALAPGDTVLLFNNGGAAPVEEMKVAGLRVEDDREILTWDRPVQPSGWPVTPSAYKFKRTFRLFGHNAPPSYTVPSAPAGQPTRITWALKSLVAADYAYGASALLYLDNAYQDLAAGKQLLVNDTGGTKTLVTITKVEQAQAALVDALKGTVTLLTVSPSIPNIADRRDVLVHELVGAPVPFWQFAYPPSLIGDTVQLPGAFVNDANGPGVEVGRTIERGAFKPGLVLRPKEIEVGRLVMLLDGAGQPVMARIKSVPTITTPDIRGFCHLAIPLDVGGTINLNARAAVLLGNVATASHGETVRNEAVGSGDASSTFQRLALKKIPLTYLPSTGPEGVASTLQLTVDGALWNEAPGLYGQPSDSRVYSVRLQDDGTAVLQFGDGTSGATLPTGRGNVTAKYRVGVGLAGRVGSDSLTTVLDRLTGLKSATNPSPAEGGADPEAAVDARRNAPRTVRTFGRAVSLRDFEDLVTASGEVAKASATWVWDGFDRAVHLTVAAQQGALFSDQALRRLGAALTAARDPNHRLRMANYVKVAVLARATVQVDPAHDRKKIGAAASQALLSALSFDSRGLGQPVNLSDVYALLQNVEGVLSVLVTKLAFKRSDISTAVWNLFLTRRGVTRLPGGAPDPVQGRLRVFPARPDPGQPGVVLPAEIAWVESPTQDVVIDVTGGMAS